MDYMPLIMLITSLKGNNHLRPQQGAWLTSLSLKILFSERKIRLIQVDKYRNLCFKELDNNRDRCFHRNETAMYRLINRSPIRFAKVAC